MKAIGLLVLAAALMAATIGCTARQLYAGGQAWQRNECFRQVDPRQREQCLQRTRVPFDQYESERKADSERTQSGPP